MGIAHRAATRRIFSISLISVLVGYTAAVGAWTENVDSLKDLNTLCKVEPEAQCTSAVRVGLEAPGADMSHSSMTTMRLDNANFQGANLSHAILQLSNLQGANLMLANLEGAHMHGVNLRNANLTMANLTKVNLMDADLTGANLRGANIKKTFFLKAILDNAVWPDGRICAEGSLGECL